MRIRHLASTCSVTAALALAAPAIAQGPGADYAPPPPPIPDWNGNRPVPHEPYMDPQARDAWLADCRRSLSRRDDGVGGAVIGGLVGGVAGNRIAGRGNRTVGTVAGAAVGAAAGMAIDRAEDNGRVRDECEAYLDDYYARYSHGGYGQGYGYGHPGHGYGYGSYGYGGGCCQQPMMMVPIVRVSRGEPECTETVEYVYEDVPVRAAPPPRPVPQKRVKVIPDKRIKTVPDKRIPQK